MSDKQQQEVFPCLTTKTNKSDLKYKAKLLLMRPLSSVQCKDVKESCNWEEKKQLLILQVQYGNHSLLHIGGTFCCL